MTHDVEDVVGELKYFHLVKKKNRWIATEYDLSVLFDFML